RRKRRRVVDGSGVSARCSSLPAPPIAPWARGNVVWGLRLSHSNRSTAGPLACCSTHSWSVAGNGSRDKVSSTCMQPCLTSTTHTCTTFGVNTETTYDWEHLQGTVLINGFVQQLLKIGTLPIAFQVGVRYDAEKPEGGPDWGLRFTTTFLFPKERR